MNENKVLKNEEVEVLSGIGAITNNNMFMKVTMVGVVATVGVATFVYIKKRKAKNIDGNLNGTFNEIVDISKLEKKHYL